MRLCCFCSMQKLDVAYRILPCRRAVLPLSRFDAEAHSWIYLVDNCTGCMDTNSEAEPAPVAPLGSETARSFCTAVPLCFQSWWCAWMLQQRRATDDSDHCFGWSLSIFLKQRKQCQPKYKHGLSLARGGRSGQSNHIVMYLIEIIIRDKAPHLSCC